MTTNAKKSVSKYGRLYTRAEEMAHVLTHGLGALLSAIGLILLVVLAVRHGDVYHIVSFSIYGATLIILYLASTLYHSLRDPALKQLFQIIDHASIYLLIAGTYTPFMLVGIRGRLGWTLLIIVWGLAFLGVGFKALYINRFEKFSVLAYVLMGWLGVVALRELIASVPTGGLLWLAGGGVVYTVGVIFYVQHRVKYTHAIWHMFVLGGSLCHYLAVLLYLAPVG